jgi:hypothetical protein
VLILNAADEVIYTEELTKINKRLAGPGEQ